MMGLGCRAGLASAFALMAWSLAGTPSVMADAASASDERIVELCLSRQQDAESCQCLSRETGSRFEPDQLQIIAEAMEAGETGPDSDADLMAQGMSAVEAASFGQRLEAADIVIRQTCGTSFFQPDAD